MPIKGVSSARRMDRLGIIRLGVKIEPTDKSPYPSATDHFVCPPEVQAVFGDKPKELAIMFPSDDEEQIARQYLRCYGRTYGLVCWGDGENGHQKTDTRTGAKADRNTKGWEWRDVTCNPQDCPEFGARCRKVMTLMFMMPDVPGIGVWQINTTSFYSIQNINTTLEIIRNLTKSPKCPEGRVSWIPLTLSLGPQVVSPPETGTKTVFILHIKSDIKMVDVIKKALLPPSRVLVPEPELEEAPDDLYPKEVLEIAEAGTPEPEPEPEVEDLFGLNAERQEHWDKIKELTGDFGQKETGIRFNAKTAQSYFAQVCDISIPLEELAARKVPPSLTVHHLKELRQRLEQSCMNLG
ncbi:MAG TPA: hypothetical protein VMW64_01080 [Dehalococcoidia bacterium]|nr:hypothetical protein [Dehalococcoidia bacterium]